MECAEWLIQMGVDIFARTTDGCTAYNLAVKSNQSVELVDYLAIRQVTVAVEHLKPHLCEEAETDGVFFPSELCTYMSIVIKHFEQQKDILLRAAILQIKPDKGLPMDAATTPVRQFHLTV